MFHNMLKNKNERYSKITNKITIARLGNSILRWCLF